MQAEQLRVGLQGILVQRSLCSRFRTPKADCSLCADVCPTEAIRVTDRGPELGAGCTACGACYAACPNGALQIEERSDESLLAEIWEQLTLGSLGVPAFRITCERGDHTADLVVPCLGRLTEAVLLEPLRLRAGEVELLQPDCAACPSAKAVSRLAILLRRTELLCRLVGGRADAIRRRSVPVRIATGVPGGGVTRRDFLAAIRTQALGMGAASLPRPFQVQEDAGGTFRDTLNRRPENVKRRLLTETLRRFGDRGSPPPSSLETAIADSPGSPGPPSLKVPSEEALLAEFDVTAQCTGCGVCATLCPTGALIAGGTDQAFLLTFRPDLCTNCGVCVAACLPKAIRRKETATLDHLLRSEEVSLFRARKATCGICRAAFVANGGDICPLCADRGRKQTAALQALCKGGQR